jgi:DNA-binding winged helix-turn-helix (wHTH) protein
VRIGFDSFTLDLDTRQLTLGGREIHLAPKALELLATLLLDRPNVISKEVLQERLWPGTFVVDANLANLVGEIREALGDSARAPRFVRTVHGFGYAFCSQGTEQPRPREEATARVSCWVESDGRRLPLGPGENMIGRDADVEVRIDASTVSRRHARIIVTADGAVLVDCGSKNGTFRGSERVSSSIRLADGDMIRIGSQVIAFHVAAELEATETQTEDRL